jgi:hypothetical protein
LSCFRYILFFGLISIDDTPRIWVCCTSLPHNGWFDELVLLLWFVVSPFHNGLLAGVVAWLT